MLHMSSDIDKYLDSRKLLDFKPQIEAYLEKIHFYQPSLHLFSNKAIECLQEQLEDAIEGSLALIDHLNSQSGVFDYSISDIGSGNGFPGVILAILKPDWQVCLIERNHKKAQFLKNISLDMSNVEVLEQDMKKAPEGKLKTSMSRAWVGLGSFHEFEKSFPAGSTHYFFKGPNWETELKECGVHRKFSAKKVKEYALPSVQGSFRCLIQFYFF